MTRTMRSLLLLVVFLFATVLAEDAIVSSDDDPPISGEAVVLEGIEVVPDEPEPCNCDVELKAAYQTKTELENSVSELSIKFATVNDALSRCNSAGASNEERLTKVEGDLLSKIIALQEAEKTLGKTAAQLVTLENELSTVNASLENQKVALANANQKSVHDAEKHAKDMAFVKGLADHAKEELAASKLALVELEAKTGGYINMGKIKDDVSKLMKKFTGDEL